jgi:hypothetical protein
VRANLHEKGCDQELLCFSFIEALHIISTGDLHCWDIRGIHISGPIQFAQRHNSHHWLTLVSGGSLPQATRSLSSWGHQSSKPGPSTCVQGVRRCEASVREMKKNSPSDHPWSSQGI